MQLRLSKIDPYAALKQLLQAGMVDPMMRRIRRRAGEQAMMQLDDHLLQDIGLTRSQVHAAACGRLRVGAAPESLARAGVRKLRCFGRLWHDGRSAEKFSGP